MSEMHFLVTDFQKSPSIGVYSVPQPPLNFNVGDLKLRDLAKLLFFKLIMTK